jgi:formate-dependent nitrite reductase membrane component NrfD
MNTVPPIPRTSEPSRMQKTATPSGGRAVAPRSDAVQAYQGPTYYQCPAVKPSGYGWLVWSYTYVAGLTGGAEIIAAIADLTGRPRLSSVVRCGRYLAATAAVIGPALLIADLHTPQRFFNMLRIFRSTSPMSIGSYILSGFSLSSSLAALGQFFSSPRRAWARRMAKAAGIPAALTGAGMTTYTGALLSSTSTPLWAAQPRLLSARFACSAMATAAAALSLSERAWGDPRNSDALDKLAVVATLAGAALSGAASAGYRRQGLDSTLEDKGAAARQATLAGHISHTVPLLCHGLGGLMPAQARSLSVAASLSILAGGLLMRSAIFRAGNESALRPRDYFQYTRPSAEAALLPGPPQTRGRR